MLTILNSIIRRTRQHHAIEHATIHLLSARFPQQRFSGHSDPLGFTILGDLAEVDLRTAVGNALLRLQAGEAELAIHPNCGTNLAVSGAFATIAAMIGLLGKRSAVDKFATALPLVLVALVMSRPVGTQLQEYTTLADVSDRWVVDIQEVTLFGQRAHRVLFE